jgi:hypothetical protein
MHSPVRVGIMKIAIQNLAVRSQHAPPSDEDARAVANQSGVVVDTHVILNLYGGRRVPGLDVDVPAQKIWTLVIAEADFAVELYPAFPHQLYRLANYRLANDVAARREKAKFGDPELLVSIDQYRSHDSL